MGSFNVITGLPRSGSTLLCNILNQRPDTFASSTSTLTQAVAGISEVFSTSPEETSRLANIEGTAEHHLKILRTVSEVWHDTDAEIVFDKGRGWARHSVTLQSMFPDAGIICLVRDPRYVLASVERANRASGQYGSGQYLWERCSELMSETGLIGSPISAVEDLIRRKLPGVRFVDYDVLVSAPERALSVVEGACGLEPFGYDFANVESTATDLDVGYRNKFPHDASGEVASRGQDWKDMISEDIAKASLERWPLYTRTFGYGL